ncbi:MAG TPA: transporter [Candidatus Polarisedimenticolaceae bacterium]|nr:transporter [Candidatus Polarisedimenticolaceae bacterium]
MRGVFVATFVLLSSAPAHAQELEPRSYSPSPVGTNFFAVAAGHLTGDVLFDPSLPIEDVHADIDVLTLGYGRTFSLAHRLGLATIAVPFAQANVDGQVFDAPRAVRRQGLADVRARVSVQVLGGKAMAPAEFAHAARRTIVGVSLTMQAPTGEYDSTKLINLGTNRWAFKPEVGVSVPVGHWSLDAYAGVWFYTNNTAFFPGGSVKRQDPLTSLQGHVTYTFKNRAWVALDGTWYGGGAVTVDENPPAERFSNSRIGGALSIPLTKRQSIKLVASTGATARTGTDFDSYVVGWQLVWFDR